MESIKGEAAENWNWQIKDRLMKVSENDEKIHTPSSNTVTLSTHEWKEEDDVNIEEELLKIDKEISKEGGYYFAN